MNVYKKFCVFCLFLICFFIIGCATSKDTAQKPEPVVKEPIIKKVVTEESEKAPIIEGLVKGKSKLKNELEKNLLKLKKDMEDGSLDLSEEEAKALEKRLADAIILEDKEIKAFRSDLNKVKFTITTSGKHIFIGKESSAGNVTVLSREGPLMARRDPWTEKKISEKELDGNRPLKMYRFDSEGKRCLYAYYNYDSTTGGLNSIEILNRDGTQRERILVGSSGYAYLVESRVGPDKWIPWPKTPNWATERIKLVLGR